jgi:Zn-finger nucleic acid-binding protein
MPERDHRLPCPVCPAVLMERVTLGGGALEIDHCRRCGGAWFEQGEVQRLRALPPAALRREVARRGAEVRHRCHDCRADLGRDEDRCAGCGAENRLECPGCTKPMSLESHGGLRLDVCRGCRGVWFDHAELEAIWGAAFAPRAVGPAGRGAEVTADAAGETLTYAILFAPDLLIHGGIAAARGASAAAEAAFSAASHLPSALGALPEAAAGAAGALPDVAAGAFEAVADASSSVFDVIASIIGGIFDGF